MLQKFYIMAATAVAFVIGALGFIAGLLFYKNYLDKPETVNNPVFRRLKIKGDGNITDLDIRAPTANELQLAPKQNIFQRIRNNRLERRKKRITEGISSLNK